ncbi:MAG: hypothetical protein M1830_005155, partial [Pleopsidium flavum]
DLILRSFVPHVAIHASEDTEELARQKGVKGGFRELLRPFGDSIQGKVVVRDSAGTSKSWDNYGVRFVGLGDGIENSTELDGHAAQSNGVLFPGASRIFDGVSPHSALSGTRGNLTQIEDLIDRNLSSAEMQPDDYPSDYWSHKDFDTQSPSSTSPFYALYLRRLLSGLPVTPHETFSHPVACIIAISSRNPSPIEALRQLYTSTSQGNGALPQWVNNEFLRYYVLVHDEDRDDIGNSTTLFDQMKRHFGLHCHLLRLRSSECVPTDDDSIELPHSAWISAAEELAEMQGNEDAEHSAPCLFGSDSAAIKTFVREMVTQSIVPFMESRVTAWNDQVASRRRGISGRFISLSKRWTGFGSSTKGVSASSLSGTTSSSGSNYDSIHGFYAPDTAEATMRKLADYAFMLRDWKLAQSTYELLRTDFGSDKAWKYHAGANEMAAISTLLGPQAVTSRSRSESIDQMLETASYSYITRCFAPYAALRCLALSVELLKLRGGSAADDAAKWATRVLDLNIVGPTGQALFTERVAACYRSRIGAGSAGWGSRRRKSALWNVLASEVWLGLNKNLQAERCLNDAEGLYRNLAHGEGGLAFSAMQGFLNDLQRGLKANLSAAQGKPGSDGAGDDEITLVEEQSERLGMREHRKSLVGAGVTPFNLADIGPLSPMRAMQQSPGVKDDSFE